MKRHSFALLFLASSLVGRSDVVQLPRSDDWKLVWLEEFNQDGAPNPEVESTSRA